MLSEQIGNKQIKVVIDTKKDGSPRQMGKDTQAQCDVHEHARLSSSPEPSLCNQQLIGVRSMGQSPCSWPRFHYLGSMAPWLLPVPTPSGAPQSHTPSCHVSLLPPSSHYQEGDIRKRYRLSRSSSFQLPQLRLITNALLRQAQHLRPLTHSSRYRYDTFR